MIAAAPASGRATFRAQAPPIRRGACHAVVRGGRDRGRLRCDHRQCRFLPLGALGARTLESPPAPVGLSRRQLRPAGRLTRSGVLPPLPPGASRPAPLRGSPPLPFSTEACEVGPSSCAAILPRLGIRTLRGFDPRLPHAGASTWRTGSLWTRQTSAIQLSTGAIER